MPILITPDILYRAAARFSVNEQDESKSAGAPGEEAHIYNLYEEFSMPLNDIIEIGRLGLEGKLENVQEKMDGQFLAFTVVNGQLRFFTKMDLQGQTAKDKKLEAIRAGGKGGGMTLDEIMSTYTGSRSNIAEGFAIAYNALEPVALKYQDTLFRNGEVVMASQIMVSKNPNTILYDKDSLRTVLAIPLTDESVNQDALSSFKLEMSQASTDAFTMDEVPTAKLMKGLKQDDAQIEQLEKDLESVVSEVGMSVSKNTVGDYIKARLEKFISEKYDFIPASLAPDVADRFMTGKGKIALRLKKMVSPEDYQKFRALDKAKSRVVQEAIIPLENIIQRLGVMIIDKIDLALTASNQEELLVFIKDVRTAFESGFDFGLESDDTKTLESIRVALARLEANEELFQRATEGIVFTYNGKTYKLTGLFTPINKMRGFFGSSMGREGFGKASLPDKDRNEALKESLKKIIMKMLAEGGNAFKKKDETGKKVVVTSEDRLTREQAIRIMDDLKQNLLGPAGIKFLPVGSTGTDKREIGDIDLVVSEPDKDTLYQTMLDAPYLREELVGGVPRVLKFGHLVAIMIEDKETGQYFQVDLFPSASMDDTEWELSGGGEGKVRGEYHKLMFSLLAKIKGERESTKDKTVKYTLAFPGGWRERINGVDVESGRIIDPDKYLPLIGIDVSKSQVRTFEDLVRYMISTDTDEFREALDRFEEYIGNRLNAKAEKTRDAAQRALNVINTEVSELSVESRLRRTITNILSEIDEEEALEEPMAPTRSNRAEKILFKKEFLAQFPDFKAMGSRAEGDREVRLGPKDANVSVNETDVMSMFQSMGYTVEQEILPGQPGSKTSKYKTWLISREGSPTFSVVFGSANKGEKFEAALHSDLAAGSGPLGDEILGALGITRDQVLSVDPPLPARPRPLTGQIRNDGAAISDITLNTSDGKVYISLKDPNGGTFANNGVAGMFVDTPKGFVPGQHSLDSFVLALGVDKLRIALGASDYKMKRDTPPERCEIVTPKTFDAQKISDYLASGLGYGYVYARKMKNGGYHIEDLKTENDVRALVGMPTSVKIIYARFCSAGKSKSKGTRVIVDTDNGARYEIAIRNKSGKIIPDQMTISIKKYPSKPLGESIIRKSIRDTIKNRWKQK